LREGPAGILAGFGLYGTLDRRPQRLATTIVWIAPNGQASEAREVIGLRLAAAARSESTCEVPANCLEEALAWLEGPVRHRLGLLGGHRWAAAAPRPAARDHA